MFPIPDPTAPAPNSPAPVSPAIGARLTAVGRRVLREPLVHFLLAGALLFTGAEVLKANARPVVHIDAQELTQLTAYWEAQMQRPPSREELRGLLRDRLDEEILAREALRLGLDRNDMIVRRRLAQKMAFASDDTSMAATPDDATLKAWYAAHRDSWLEPSHLSFRQMVFAGDHQGGEAEVAAQTALTRLRHSDPDVRGEPFMLPLTYGDVPTTELARDYGQGFVEALVKAPVGVWTGPVASAYGVHLVRVEARDPPRQRPFADVRDEVRDAWAQAQRKAGNAAFMQRLRARYRIVVDGLKDGAEN